MFRFSSRILGQPVVRAALTSCAVMAAGDVASQALRTGRTFSLQSLDKSQTARFAVVGLTLHGPYFFRAFRWLDALPLPAAAGRTQQAVLRTLAGQVTVFPVYLAAFFTYMGLLEGLTLRECAGKVERGAPVALGAGTLFWVPANVINFSLVPPAGRVLYVNVAGLLWNSFLSWTNADTVESSLAAKKEAACYTQRL